MTGIVLQIPCTLFVKAKSLFYLPGTHQVSESQGSACFLLLSARITSIGNHAPTSTLLTELATEVLKLQMFKTTTKLLVDACVGNDRFLLRMGAGMLTHPPSRQPNQTRLASGQRL